MLTLIRNRLLQNGYARFITERFELLAILRDVPTFINLQSAECQVGSAYAVGQRRGLTSRISAVLGQSPAHRPDAPSPEVCVVLLRRCEATQCVATVWITLVLGECRVGREALHLGLKVFV